MTVTPLEQRRQQREAGLAVAMQRHPAGRHLLGGDTVHVPLIDRAHSLEVLCREWDQVVDRFSTGPDCLEHDEAEELLQFLCAAVVHPHAVPGLVFQLPQLRAAVAQHDAVRDGEITAFETGCSSFFEALGKARSELDWLLSPLVHGIPAADMCRDCVRTRASVETWQTKTSCPDHRRAL